jgi:hypothetical protein
VAKAEYLETGENPRFIDPSLEGRLAGAPLYEEPYYARGDMENRIKEPLMLFADRTSTAYLRSNQLRLYFSSITYVLLQMLRRLELRGTELAADRCATVRLKLFKTGALVRITVRKAWVSLSSASPYARAVVSDPCPARCFTTALLTGSWVGQNHPSCLSRQSCTSARPNAAPACSHKAKTTAEDRNRTSIPHPVAKFSLDLPPTLTSSPIHPARSAVVRYWGWSMAVRPPYYRNSSRQRADCRLGAPEPYARCGQENRGRASWRSRLPNAGCAAFK